MAIVFIVVPGPSVLFTIGRGIALGSRAAVGTVLGNSVGVFVQGSIVAFGVGAILTHSPAIRTILRIGGALYLAYLGVRTWRHRHDRVNVEIDGTTQMPMAKVIAEGVWVGFANPKTAVFMAAILPQFANSRYGNLSWQMLAYNLEFGIMGFISDSVYGILAGTFRGWLSGSSRRLANLSGAGGLLIVVMGVSLLIFGG
ncbi:MULTISPECIES: LysE family translocator [Acidithrix]|uniref:Homoserine/homoserine lactone efflux protein n=2 Tax=root TaxID=1 RepID=A0A0D8HJG5_9ACTN|nr:MULTISPECIES: LysE family translocator [Acidithrix]KJF17231.1 homoserine/homoserine lactone efflux protein [Acidithrix ferrooxidans]